MFKKIIFLLPAIIIVPVVALAANSYVYDVELLPEMVESSLELFNLLVAIFAAALAIKLAALSQGGSLEKTWNSLAIAAVVFAAVEATGALQGFGLVHLGGLGDILETVFLLIFASVFYKTRKALLKQTLG